MTIATSINPTVAHTRLRVTFAAGVALAAAAFFSFAGASPAFAHDQLIDSNPTPGQVLDTSPEQIELEFSADIIEVGTAVVVVDHHGEEIDVGEPVVVGPTVTAPLPADLEGDYQVRWRAVSSDGHPVDGVIDFGVGADATGVWEGQESHATEGGAEGGDDTGAGDDAAEQPGPEAWVIGFVVGLVIAGAGAAVIVAVVVKSRRKAPGAE